MLPGQTPVCFTCSNAPRAAATSEKSGRMGAVWGAGMAVGGGPPFAQHSVLVWRIACSQGLVHAEPTQRGSNGEQPAALSTASPCKPPNGGRQKSGPSYEE